MKPVLLALILLMLTALSGGAAANCFTDTNQADFQNGTASNVDMASSPGNVVLSRTGGGGATIDQQNTSITANGEKIGKDASGSPNAAHWVSQTFTPAQSGALTRIDLNLFCVFCSAAPPSLIVSVRAASGTGPDLASSTLSITDWTGTQAWYTASFAAPATVTARTQYAIVIRVSSNYTSGTIALSDSAVSSSTGNDVYSGGAVNFSLNGGSSWTLETGPKPSVDGGFKTYIGGSASGYVSAGNLASSVKDSNPGTATPNWSTLSWTNTLPAATSVRFQAAASNNSTGPFNFVGPDNTSATYFTASGASLSQFNGFRYLKYRAFLATDSGSVTPTLSDATACYTTVASASADLSISNSDGATTETPGTPVTYTITASNPAGSSSVTGANVTDTFPATLNSCAWSCSGAGGGTCGAASGSGNINSLVNLPAGASVTYSATCTIASSATGSLSNTASIAVPAGVTDPTPGNNSATDIDTLAAQADLSITNSDGVASAPPGGSVTYTIAASNAGPSSVTGAVVHDSFSSGLTCNWTCTGTGGGTCAASGSGNLNHTVGLPKGASVAFVATCAIATTASGTLTNTASVSPPAGVTDPTPGNNSATDSDALAANADLAITNSDGVTTANPGGSVTYTIKASNLDSDFVGDAVVTDSFSSGLTCNWTCAGAGGGTCAASGSGNLNHKVNLPGGASVTFTATCAISATASGTLTNTATITAPASVTDPSLGNNSATDTDSLGVGASPPAVSLTDKVDFVRVGDVVDYVIHVSNPGDSISPTITDALPTQQLSGQTWVCTPHGGATCGSSSGSGDTLTDVPTLPAGGAVDYTYTVTVLAANANDEVSNTASMKITGGHAANMSASDADTVVVFISGFEGGTTPLAMIPAGSSATGSVTAQLGVDGGLLTKLSVVPVTIASAQSASGQTLFGLQLMRSGNNVLLRSVTTIDGGPFSDVSPWQVVDLRALRLGFEWQSATTRGDDGFLNVATGSSQMSVAANNEKAFVTQLQIAVENNIPWLVPIDQ